MGLLHFLGLFLHFLGLFVHVLDFCLYVLGLFLHVLGLLHDLHDLGLLGPLVLLGRRGLHLSRVLVLHLRAHCLLLLLLLFLLASLGLDEICIHGWWCGGAFVALLLLLRSRP